jgi:hypothetical protein
VGLLEREATLAAAGEDEAVREGLEEAGNGGGGGGFAEEDAEIGTGADGVFPEVLRDRAVNREKVALALFSLRPQALIDHPVGEEQHEGEKGEDEKGEDEKAACFHGAAGGVGFCPSLSWCFAGMHGGEMVR